MMSTEERVEEEANIDKCRQELGSIFAVMMWMSLMDNRKLLKYNLVFFYPNSNPGSPGNMAIKMANGISFLTTRSIVTVMPYITQKSAL